MAGIEHSNVTNEEFMEEVPWYECVYNSNSKNFKDKNKKANTWEKIGEKFNLSYLSSWLFFDVSFDFEADVVVALGLKKELYFLLDVRHVVCSDFPARTTRGYILHFHWTKCIPTVGSAIVCDYMEAALFAIVCDLRSAIVCDRLRSYGNQPLVTKSDNVNKQV